jgi:hypothetical protein
MSLELWIGQGVHFFVDTFGGIGSQVQVGQAFQEDDGSWTVEVNNEFVTAPDLETAKRLFVEKYDRSKVQLSPGSLGDGQDDLSDGFTIIDLSPLEKLSGRNRDVKSNDTSNVKQFPQRPKELYEDEEGREEEAWRKHREKLRLQAEDALPSSGVPREKSR